MSNQTHRNQYQFLMIIRNGKVVEFKDYLDAMHANDVLVGGAV